jgi:AcrR family transcriptional regulator
MKVSREQAAANRERIVEVAGKLFRENGFDGIGVTDLMKAAGLTHGGFYGHFRSKDDLAAEACSRTMARASERWATLARTSPGDARAEIVKQYLTESHCDGREGMPARGARFRCRTPRTCDTTSLQGRSRILGRHPGKTRSGPIER